MVSCFVPATVPSIAQRLLSVLAGAMFLLACVGAEGGDIGAPVLALDALSSPAGPGSAEPNLSSGPDGRVYLSWLEPVPDSAYALRFATLNNGTWSETRTIASGRNFFVNWADFPSLAALPDGRLAAHWLQRSGGGKYSYDVRIAQSLDGGETWGVAVVPHRDSTQTEHGFVSLFPVGDSLGAVWLDGRKYARRGARNADEMQLAYTTIDAGGALGAELLLDDRICDCCQTAAAMTIHGPVVVYRDRSAGEIRDIAIVRLVNGRWTAPRLVVADGWKIPACPVNGPAIAARGELVAVAWYTAAGDTARVRVAFSADAGATFGAPIRVDGGQPAGRVAIALADHRSAFVSWIERRGGEAAEVQVRRVEVGGRMSEPIAITSSTAARASGFPRMTRGSADEIVFAWTEPGSPSAVRVARARVPRGDGE